MAKRVLPILAICLLAAGAAHAQYGGGMGGGGMGGGMGGGGRHGGGGGGHRQRPSPDSSAPSSSAAPAPERRAPTPLNRVEIIGVVKAIDPAGQRITIAYEPVDALNWPAGTMPFVVARTEILGKASVGEKVRFHIESQQIETLEPYTPRPGDTASN
jgi:Cu/Ag efflux protein CusF